MYLPTEIPPGLSVERIPCSDGKSLLLKLTEFFGKCWKKHPEIISPVHSLGLPVMRFALDKRLILLFDTFMLTFLNKMFTNS